MTIAADTIPIARPWMGEEEVAAARRAILSGWVTQGPEVAAFEREFSAAVGAPYACAVSSCTAALQLALLALDVGRGDEVVTVSHSFIATANAIRYCGALPVFVDVEPGTFNIDPRLVANAMTERTRALLVVHQLGMPCDMNSLLRIARERRIPVVEDAACATGSEILWNGEWQRIGRPHGDIACFSFHPRKLLSTGDGGMLTTGSGTIDARLRQLRQHGMSIVDTVRHTSPRIVFEQYPILGFNYRMTDIQAAVGREQLKRLPAMVAQRRRQAARYRNGLQDLSAVTLPTEPEWARSNWQSYAIRIGAGVDQRTVMQRLLDQGISTRRGVMNAHCEPAYPPGSWRGAPGRLRHSEAARDSAVMLPLFHEMTEHDQDRVIAALRNALAPSSSIS